MDDDDGLGDFFADVGDAAAEGEAVAKAAEAPKKVLVPPTVNRPTPPAAHQGASRSGGGSGGGGVAIDINRNSSGGKGGGRFFDQDDGLSAYSTREVAAEPAAAARSRHAPQQWSKGILPLEPLDHSTIQYEPFGRVFYKPKVLVPREEVERRRASLGVFVKGEPYGTPGVAP